VGLISASCTATRAPAAGQTRTQRFSAGADGGFELPDGFFPILPWELTEKKSAYLSEAHHGIESLRECGFNTAAFVRPEQLKTCEKLGLRAIVRPSSSGVVKWLNLSDEQITATVKKQIEDAGDSKAILGYFLADEPGVQKFAALAKAVAAVKKLAPGKLAYINLYPNYATLGAHNLSQLGTENYAEYLERFVREVKPQILSYDNYNVEFSGDLEKSARAAKYYTNLLDVRRIAAEHHLPFWNIVTSNQIRPYTTPPSPANLLLQAYTTLAAGARGLTWFTYYTDGYRYGPIDASGNRSATWSYLKMVNQQVGILGRRLARLRSTGVYFTAPPAPGLATLPGKFVQSVQSATPMMIGEFTDSAGEGARYAMVVNLSLTQSARFAITLAGAAPAASTAPTRPTKLAAPDESRLRCVSPADGSSIAMEPGNAWWLTAGQGVLIELGE
jgi:hypothetical protein